MLFGLSWIYALAVLLMAVFGFNILLVAALAAWPRRPRPAAPPPSVETWPTVLVQLPLFNERYVAERLIDAAAALDYPADKLTIQVLDDSTDDCAALARARVAFHRARGRPITYLHRTRRDGYKGGALAEGLRAAPGEFVAIFDADFVPPSDFLRRTIPSFFADATLGLVQARWEHLNAEQNLLTRAQAIAFDGFFAVDQAARSRFNLLMTFNGSAGVWRRAAIEAAGDWAGDTLTEDLDLTYRAYFAGWRMDYLPDVIVPAELTPSIIAFKRQQARWAKGSFQVLRKLGRRLLASPRFSALQKVEGFFYMAGYLPHLLMVTSLLTSLPVVLWHGQNPLHWSLLGLAGLGLPLTALWSQLTLRKDWPRRLLAYPVLFLVGIGLAVTNTRAILEALLGAETEFVRTPKFSATAQRANAYALGVDWATWVELALAGYALATCLLAVELAPELVPFTALYALGFGFTAILGFWQSGGVAGREDERETA
jgi:cellulose synthase/poly-beta-1,6-N-acetylglucosamine synthase-like glycosyltransferase